MGHPDVIADTITNSILISMLNSANNPASVRAGVEVFNAWRNGITHIAVGGEIKSDIITSVDKYSDEQLKNDVVKSLQKIGYLTDFYSQKFKPNEAVNLQQLEIHNFLNLQANYIAQATDKVATGDQGIYWGYASNQTPTFEDTQLYLAKQINKLLYEMALKSPYYGIDIKTQAEIKFENEIPVEITKIVVAIPLSGINCDDKFFKNFREQLKEIIVNFIKNNSCLNKLRADKIDFYINATGLKEDNAGWVGEHGNIADSGLTGRKLAVHTTGGHRLGGGALSKDATKSDVSVNLFCRYLAKNIVNYHKDLTSAEIGLSTAIGLTGLFEPEIHLTSNTLNQEQLQQLENDLTVKIKQLPEFLDYKTLITNLAHFGTKKPPFVQSSYSIFGDEAEDNEYEKLNLKI